MTVENNILKFVCLKNKFVSSGNIIGSKTEELGRSLTYNKKTATVLVLGLVGLHKEYSECLF